MWGFGIQSVVQGLRSLRGFAGDVFHVGYFGSNAKYGEWKSECFGGIFARCGIRGSWKQDQKLVPYLGLRSRELVTLKLKHLGLKP